MHRHVFLKGPCGYSDIPKFPQAFASTGAYRKKHAAVLRKGPCGHSNIPKSPQAFTSTGAYRKKHAAFLLKGPCGHSNIPKSPQMIASIGVYRKMRADYGSPSRLAPAAPSERGRLFVRGKRAAMSGVSAAHPRGQAPNPNPSGTADPKAHRRRSRRSNDRQDKPIHARRGPSAKPKPRRHSQPQERPGGKAAAATPIRTDAPTRDKGPQRTQPDGQLRPRKTTAQTTRTRQRRAAQAAQTAVGDAQ